MQYRALGRSGLVVSSVGIGCNNFGKRLDQVGTNAVVQEALDQGITLFDTADMYGPKGLSEEYLGSALLGHRDDVIIATKFGMDVGGMVGPTWLPRGSREYIVRAVEGSLRRLQTDRIDLFQYHEPDNITPIEETMAAMDELISAGKVRYIGTSNMDAWQLIDAAWMAEKIGTSRFLTTQTPYHLMDRRAEKELVPAALRVGMSILPYYPLANGLLTGKYRKGEPVPEGSRLTWRTNWGTEAALEKMEELRSFAGDRGLTLLELAIGGLGALPAVGSVIAGAMRPDQVRSNAAAASWIPNADDLTELNNIVAPGECVIG